MHSPTNPMGVNLEEKLPHKIIAKGNPKHHHDYQYRVSDGLWHCECKRVADIYFTTREKSELRMGKSNVSTAIKQIYLYLKERREKKGMAMIEKYFPFVKEEK